MLVFATRDVNRGARDCRRRSGVAQGPSVLAFERAAHVAARRAGALIRARYGERQQVSFKSEVDLVTTVDREAERLILDTLRAAFPDHGMIAEESTASPGRDGHRWYVDPLDGTTNFAHGYPHFAVSDTAMLERALVATGFPYDRRQHGRFYLGFWEAVMARAQDVRRGGSAALDLCYVACGRLDAFWEWKLQPWDTAAGRLIVEEAGGRVTDFAARPHRLAGDQTAASNGRLHDDLLRVLAGAGAGTAV